ncbi:MAG: BON domain-containing protein [Planctomycetales bacterium]|nr:BON domain-containing protein [Planctomycetales bacterium]
MRISGAMSDYDMAVKYSEGTAWLRGRVASSEQMATALEIAKASPRVDNVVNQLTVARSRSEENPVSQAAIPPPDPPAPPVTAPQPLRRAGPVPFGSSSLPGGPQQLIRPVAALAAAGAPGQPQPAFVPGTGGGVAPATFDQPSLPGYGWPSYAAYPNYAGLTYPRQYSPTAWPYIGPFYPYPQVPLGWRKVTLQWDDGWWFLDFKDH